jgi:putative transposase
MAAYRRLYIPGGTYFFTVTAQDREHQDLIVHAAWLKACIRAEQQIASFAVLAAVLLPDHLHMIWRLPASDADYSGRWRRIKTRFSRALRPCTVRRSVYRKGERGIWQRRFWEHVIRDERELSACIHYVHMNPIKHGHVTTPDAWEHTTFHAWQRRQIAWHSACRHTHNLRPTPSAS